jgi:hypothetical protein
MEMVKSALPVPFLKVDMIGGWMMRTLGKFLGSFGHDQIDLVSTKIFLKVSFSNF